MSILFESYRLGDLELKNRVVMAPLTRARAESLRIPNELMAEYYAQRAGAGLILTEATIVSAQGAGYAETPGIWSEAQVEGWKLVTQKVHAQGSKIFSQLWHVGRISDPQFLGGETPVAPSAIAAVGHVSLVRPLKDYVTPRALETNEIPQIVEDFRKGAENAKLAGFDGVEIHAANGYLIDQFLQSTTNIRTDYYGGSVENRARFLLEIVDAAISVWGPGRVGVHLAPRSDSHSMGDENPAETFGHVARELGNRKIAFLFLRESQGPGYQTAELKKIFGGTIIANQGLTQELAESLIEKGAADLASFGMLYISNPDLVERFERGLPLNEVNVSTIYAKGSSGYTDYPVASRTLERT
ncbi:MAG: alkene reductase [Bdellovibrionales bacterium]|nr:alkene reductase [Oligoflexia bacterium]